MKLINFHQSKSMSNLLKKMGAELKTMASSVAWQNIDDEKLKELLQTGVTDIDISEIDIDGNILKYKGKKIIIYIRDQYQQFYDKGYKYHLSNCTTISKAIVQRRKSRYVISLRTDGVFKINLMQDDIIVKRDLNEPLTVCKNCLTNLNYKGFANLGRSAKTNIYDSFNLKEYFKEYELIEQGLFDFQEETNAPINIYNPDFKERSLEFRKSKNFICQECKVDLSAHQKYLHVHHIDGNKANDGYYNLKAVCIECHSKEPEHNRLKYHPDYNEFLRIYSDKKNIG
jgi:hypothetical protein